MPYPSSKTALNALTAHYARELSDKPVKVDGAALRNVATDFNEFNSQRTREEGSRGAIRLATLDAEVPDGVLYEDEVRLRRR